MPNVRKFLLAGRSVALVALALVLPVAAAEARVNLRLATVAPRGSAYHLILDKMAAEIGRETGGEVRIRIIAGGAAGDETAMISKMRIGQVQMAAVSNVGLAELDPSAWTLSIPMVFRDYPEWDHVREAMNPAIADTLQGHGFQVIALGRRGLAPLLRERPREYPRRPAGAEAGGRLERPDGPRSPALVGLRPGPDQLRRAGERLPDRTHRGGPAADRARGGVPDLPLGQVHERPPLGAAAGRHHRARAGLGTARRVPAGSGAPEEQRSGGIVPRDQPRAGAESRSRR